jgi:hypothetical protein
MEIMPIVTRQRYCPSLGPGFTIVGPVRMSPFGDFSTKKKKTLLNYLLKLLGHYGSRLGVSKLTIMHK